MVKLLVCRESSETCLVHSTAKLYFIEGNEYQCIIYQDVCLKPKKTNNTRKNAIFIYYNKLSKHAFKHSLLEGQHYYLKIFLIQERVTLLWPFSASRQ